jgi:hypothetical protein
LFIENSCYPVGVNRRAFGRLIAAAIAGRRAIPAEPLLRRGDCVAVNFTFDPAFLASITELRLGDLSDLFPLPEPPSPGAIVIFNPGAGFRSAPHDRYSRDVCDQDRLPCRTALSDM